MTSRLLAQGGGGGGGGTNNVFGKINTPDGVSTFDKASGASNFGLILFMSNAIKVITLVAGLWVFFTIISAGLSIISASGDASATDKAKDQILHAVIGLAVIIFSYVLIAIISVFFFGKADYILNPVITGP